MFGKFFAENCMKIKKKLDQEGKETSPAPSSRITNGLVMKNYPDSETICGSHGVTGTSSPLGSNFFHLHVVFGKICKIIGVCQCIIWQNRGESEVADPGFPTVDADRKREGQT